MRIAASEFALGGLREVTAGLARRIDQRERHALDSVECEHERGAVLLGEEVDDEPAPPEPLSSAANALRHHVDSLPSGRRLAPIFRR